MQTGKLITELERERGTLFRRVEAIDKALDGLRSLQELNGAKGVKLPADAGKGTKAVSLAAKAKKTAKRPQQPKVDCPDCGTLQRKGPGMAAHRKAAHGWRKGMPLDKPVPRAQFIS